jgi:hypothetical protein
MPTIDIPYVPRDAFVEYHGSPKRFALGICHRRSGKSVSRINRLIRAAASERRPGARYAYAGPTYAQTKDVAWAYLKRYAWPAIQATGGTVNESELSITFGHNGAVVRLYGLENYDRLRGLAFAGIVIDEAQDVTPAALTTVILPALTDWQGWLDAVGTPRGRAGLLYSLYKQSQANPDIWFSQTLKASQTGILPAAELEMLKRTMSANEYEQELEVSFDAAVTGAYYAELIDQAEVDGRICDVPVDPALEVHTAWDLGISDSTSIVFWQALRGGSLRVIDYAESAGYGLDHYAKLLDKRGYKYGKHWAPHDIAVRELGTGKSRLETAASLGIYFSTVPKMSLEDGINAVRMMLPKVWFDRKRTDGLVECLRLYRQKWDEKRGISLGPLHNFTSHAADAFRYLALAAKEPLDEPEEQRVLYPDPHAWML